MGHYDQPGVVGTAVAAFASGAQSGQQMSMTQKKHGEDQYVQLALLIASGAFPPALWRVSGEQTHHGMNLSAHFASVHSHSGGFWLCVFLNVIEFPLSSKRSAQPAFLVFPHHLHTSAVHSVIFIFDTLQSTPPVHSSSLLTMAPTPRRAPFVRVYRHPHHNACACCS